jgi:heme exporter protein D
MMPGMMPDLGKYAVSVLGSYAATIALFLGLVALSLWQSRRTKRQLTEVETRAGKENG